MSPRYASPAAFRTAVENRLKIAAKNAGRPVNELRRQYLTQRFLARVYAAPHPEWILLGGTALLARIPGARHSRDVDFLHPHDLTDAAAALADLIAVHPAPDPFSFDITTTAPPDDDHVTLKVTARLGATVIDTFPSTSLAAPSRPAWPLCNPNQSSSSRTSTTYPHSSPSRWPSRSPTSSAPCTKLTAPPTYRRPASATWLI